MKDIDNVYCIRYIKKQGLKRRIKRSPKNVKWVVILFGENHKKVIARSYCEQK